MLWNKARDKDKDKEQQEVCQYCLEHKDSSTMTIPVYYKHGQAMRYVTICHDCSRYESENLDVKPRTVSMADIHNHDDYALEAICQVIRRITMERRQMNKEAEAMAEALPLLTAYDYVQRFDAERIKSLSPCYPLDPIDFYEAVRMAYSESQELRNYLGLDCSTVDEIDKDLKTLWPLTYRVVHELQIDVPRYNKAMLQILNVDLMGIPKSDELVLRWVIFAPTPMEQAEQERQQQLSDKTE